MAKTVIMKKDRIKSTFDFKSFEESALLGLQNGQTLMGKDGIFTPLLKHFLEASLEAEFDEHLLSEGKGASSNRRNGLSKKRVKSGLGSFDLHTPRDRQSSFEPQIVAKRQVVLTEQLEEKILSMYGRGMSYSDINGHLEELYGYRLSTGELSNITDKIVPVLREWQQRPLEGMYVALWLDAQFYKIRQDGKVISKALYSVIGLSLEGKKEVLGIYLAENEGAKFWLSVLQDLRQRGVEDVIFACVDGLKGFPEAINTVFPKALVQLCVVHMVRYAIRPVADKDVKDFMKDLKAVYQAPDLATAEDNLLSFEQNWSKVYPQSVATWTNNWQHIATFFDFSFNIRKIIYTTNTIESYHRQLRKMTKTKAAFTSDNALFKVAFLAIQNMHKVWDKKTFNWKAIFNELLFTFEDRIKPFLI